MKSIAVFFACIVLPASFLKASEGEASQTPAPVNPNYIYIGPEAFLFDLNTHVQTIKINGLKVFGGLRLRYEYLKPKAFYAGVDLFSALTNKGFKAKGDGINFHQNNSITGFSNFELRLGYAFAPKNGTLAPFLGFGGYYFANNGSHFHFREEMLYYAAGIRSLFELGRLFSMGLNMKVFHTFSAEQRFKYKTTEQTVKYTDHGNMWGGEVGVPFMWYLGQAKKWNVLLEPYFLKINFSEVQNIYGTRLLFGYRF